MCSFEKTQISGRMNRGTGARTIALRRHEPMAIALGRLLQHHRPGGNFRARLALTTHQESGGVMPELRLGEDDLHGASVHQGMSLRSRKKPPFGPPFGRVAS